MTSTFLLHKTPIKCATHFLCVCVFISFDFICEYVLMLNCIYTTCVFHCKLHWHLRILTMNEAPQASSEFLVSLNLIKRKKNRMQHNSTNETNCFELKLNLYVVMMSWEMYTPFKLCSWLLFWDEMRNTKVYRFSFSRKCHTTKLWVFGVQCTV